MKKGGEGEECDVVFFCGIAREGEAGLKKIHPFKPPPSTPPATKKQKKIIISSQFIAILNYSINPIAFIIIPPLVSIHLFRKSKN